MIQGAVRSLRKDGDVAVQLRKMHRPALDAGAVVHAHLDARFGEACAAAALAMACTLHDGHVVVIGKGAKARRIVEDCARSLGSRPASGSSANCKGWVMPLGGTIWFAAPDLEEAEVPIPMVRRAWAFDCHLMDADPTPAWRPNAVTLVGAMPERGHWFHSHYSRATMVRATDVIAEYPDEKQRVDVADPMHERQMMLADVMPDFSGKDIWEFAQERLHCLSDKPVQFMSQRQQVAAKDQLGVHKVVPVDPTALQRWYSAECKRVVDEVGGKDWIILVKYRRGGFTLTEQAHSYRIAVTQPNSQVVTLADTWAKSRKIFEMVELFHKRDPRAPRLKGEPSKTALNFANGSSFYVGTAGSDAFSRGQGVSSFHGSEAAFWLRGNEGRIDATWSGIAEAAKHGRVRLESTPNGREWFCQQYQRAKAGDSELKPVFVAWFRDPMNRAKPGSFDPDELRDTLTPQEESLIQQHSLDMAQVAFRREVHRIHRALALQEFPEDDVSCFITSGHMFFDVETVLHLQMTVLDAGEKINFPGGTQVTWSQPKPGVDYVLGADCSEGIPGGDPCGVGVMERDSGLQVAAIHGHFPPKVLAEHVVRLSKHYNGALCGVERNNHGHAVLLKMDEMDYIGSHVRGGPVFYFSDSGAEQSLRQHNPVDAVTRTGRPGWDTNEARRATMLDDLRDWTIESPECIQDRLFVDEMTTFRMQDNGRWDHDAGAHDDTLFKWGIALQMRKVPKRRAPTIRVSGGS